MLPLPAPNLNGLGGQGGAAGPSGVNSQDRKTIAPVINFGNNGPSGSINNILRGVAQVVHNNAGIEGAGEFYDYSGTPGNSLDRWEAKKGYSTTTLVIAGGVAAVGTFMLVRYFA